PGRNGPSSSRRWRSRCCRSSPTCSPTHTCRRASRWRSRTSWPRPSSSRRSRRASPSPSAASEHQHQPGADPAARAIGRRLLGDRGPPVVAASSNASAIINPAGHSPALRKDPAMTQYMLAVHHSPDAPPPPPDQMQQAFDQVNRFNAELQESGAWVFAGGLHPPEIATVVRSEGGDTITTDGPFAESKEQLGGFWVI